MPGKKKNVRAGLDVVRHNAEHLVLQKAAEGLQPGAISIWLRERHGKEISAGAINHYLERVKDDPVIQRAIALAQQRPTEVSKGIQDFESDINAKVRMLEGFLTEVKDRYIDGKTMVPGDLKSFILTTWGIAPTKAQWDQLMGIVEQQSLDRAIDNITKLSKEIRAYMETHMKMRQILPQGDTHIHLTQINQMVGDMLDQLCEGCKLRIAGIEGGKVIDVAPTHAQ